MSARPGERGFALIASLWAVTLLATIALALGLEQRSRRLVALNRADEARSHAAAEAGLAHARALLTRLADGTIEDAGFGGGRHRLIDPWHDIGEAALDTIQLGDAWFAGAFENVGARLNVNRASVEELGRFLIALRIDAGDADRLSQAIADWRDADSEHRARGAEVDRYLEEDRAILPANGPFAAVTELRHVIGMTPEILERIEPMVTVDGSGRVDAHAAPPEVLLAFPGMTPDAALALLRMRRAGERLSHLGELAPRLPAASRDEFMAHLPRLMGQLTLESSEIAAVAVGGVHGGPIRSTGRALFVRSAGSVYRIESRIE